MLALNGKNGSELSHLFDYFFMPKVGSGGGGGVP